MSVQRNCHNLSVFLPPAAPKTPSNVTSSQNRFTSGALAKQFCSVALKCVQLSKKHYRKQSHSIPSTFVQNASEDLSLIRILPIVWTDWKNISTCVYYAYMDVSMYSFITKAPFHSFCRISQNFNCFYNQCKEPLGQ